MSKKSGLGRGLDKLLSSANSESVTDASQLKLLAVEKFYPALINRVKTLRKRAYKA